MLVLKTMHYSMYMKKRARKVVAKEQRRKDDADAAYGRLCKSTIPDMQVLAIAGQRTDPTIVPPTTPHIRPANRHAHGQEKNIAHCSQLSRAGLFHVW